jgi:hypothetical protein
MLLLFRDLRRLICRNDLVIGGFIARPGWSGTVVAGAAGRAIGRANAKDASSEIRHGSTYEHSRTRCMQRKTRPVTAVCAKTHAAHALNLKVALLPTSQHSTAQDASKQAPPRGQGRLVIFASCFHMLAVAHPTCRASTSLKSCLICTEQHPESNKARQRCAGSDVGEQKLLSAVQHTKALMSGINPSATAEPALPPKKPCPNLRYVSYGTEKESPFLPAIRQLISNDLSEPYSIYVYRYFLYQWGHLCFMVCLYRVHLYFL